MMRRLGHLFVALNLTFDICCFEFVGHVCIMSTQEKQRKESLLRTNTGRLIVVMFVALFCQTCMFAWCVWNAVRSISTLLRGQQVLRENGLLSRRPRSPKSVFKSKLCCSALLFVCSEGVLLGLR